ncbi:MAG: CapA family protein [Lachnospiraceae bacterium]|nr:CapA family protein [Lachnospiraceae bacterium]
MEENYIIVGADFAPINRDGEKIIQNRQQDILEDSLADIIKRASLSVFNMEAPIKTDSMKPIKKDGPNLFILPGAERIYEDLQVGVLSLANNHIMDYGENGLCYTIECLNKRNIAYIGAGKNKQQADFSAIKEVAGKKIGIYAAAEHEFSLAEENKAGANGFEEPRIVEAICRLKEKCDYLIMLYHGGRELYRYPSVEQQKICRRLAEAGADLIVCQHSHCIGAYETYKGSSIFYGQGNFLFGDAEHEVCINSILLKIPVERDKIGVPKIIPIKREREKVILLTGEEKEKVRNLFEKLSEDIKKPEFVEKNYKKLADEAIAAYLYQFAGWPLFFIRLDKLFGRRMIKSFFRRNEKRLLYLQNILQCEAHREIVLEGLKGLRRDK